MAKRRKKMHEERPMRINVKQWLSSSQLVLCSPATRGVWFDWLCFMHNGRGDGLKGELWQLRNLGHCNDEEAATALVELARHRVASVERDGDYYLVKKIPLNADRCATVAWRKKRLKILNRDGRICRYCGAAATAVDHIIPASRGGDDTDENLVAACRPCNSRKHARTPAEAGMVLHG